MAATGGIETRWLAQPDSAALTAAALEYILTGARRAIDSRGVFHLVLAGGETPRPVYSSLRKCKVDWRAWQIYFGDERCLPQDDPERNSRMALDAIFAHVPLPAKNFHPIRAELGAVAAAAQYSTLLHHAPEFDLVILGLGEDGHTASLFPGNDAGDAADAPPALPVFNSPKPPPERVTLSASRLGRTRKALFLVSGESKRAAVARWRGGEDIPAAHVRPQAGVDVMLDAALLRTRPAGGPAASAS
jgi:6-phosphogluconolactonase